MTLHSFERQEPDTQTLLQEANHRIANQLALLASTVQIQLSGLSRGPAALPREDVKRSMQEIASKIISVAHLHRRLADQPYESEIDLGDYLIESTTNLVTALSLGDRVRVIHRLDAHCRVRAERAQAIVLLISEIMMNAVKHAHPTGIAVVLQFSCSRASNGTMTLQIGDDGIGLPEDFDPELDGGVGFKLIRAFAEKLGATLRIVSDSLGTDFILTIPSESSRVVQIGGVAAS
jgi:two-component sensor histidine kinase